MSFSGEVPFMNAMILHRYGGVDELQCARVPRPQVGPNDILIAVKAAGVGKWDAEERRGEYDGLFGMPATFPYILGWEGAGIVEQVGPDVRGLAIGNRVFAASMPLPRGGFYADYAVVDQEHVAPIPADLSFAEAATLAWDGLTALSGMDLLKLTPGQTLLVFGASGGIGHFALQLAKARGIRVLAAASGEDGVAFARSLGAEQAVDGRKHSLAAVANAMAPNGLDAALFTAGGPAAEEALGMLKEGALAVYPNGVSAPPAARPSVSIQSYDGDRTRPALERLSKFVLDGHIKPHLAGQFPLSLAGDAHRALESHFVGKYVLEV